jgi:fucose permease
MASAAEVRVVNAAGLVQGITLVTFPAASSILTRASGYDLSSAEYGTLFLPQVVTAIAASLLGSRLGAAITLKRVLLLGLAANAVSMCLLLVSATVQSNLAVAYPLLLLSTAFLGLGFGLTVPTLNTYVAAFRPDAEDRAVLVLNALLGLGTALAPVIVAVFDGLGFWWGLPLLSTTLLVGILLACARLPLEDPAPVAPVAGGVAAHAAIPPRFWLFAAFAVLYGVCETMNGNWSQVYMTGTVHSTSGQASIALATFWALVTVGRVGFAAAERWVPERVTYHVLPFVLVVTFALVAALSTGQVWQGIVLFGLAGLGCSALLPLTISYGEEQLTTMAAAAAGGVIACYQIGYGLAAFGVGPLLGSGRSLSGLYAVTAGVALLMGVVSFAVARRPILGSAASSTVLGGQP